MPTLPGKGGGGGGMPTLPGKGGGGGGGMPTPPGKGGGGGMLGPPGGERKAHSGRGGAGGGGGGLALASGRGGVGTDTGGTTGPESPGKGGAGGTVALLGGPIAVTAAEREATSFLASSSSLDSLATYKNNTKRDMSHSTSGTTGKNLRNYLIQTSHFTHEGTRWQAPPKVTELLSNRDKTRIQVFMFLAQYALH